MTEITSQQNHYLSANDHEHEQQIDEETSQQNIQQYPIQNVSESNNMRCMEKVLYIVIIIIILFLLCKQLLADNYGKAQFILPTSHNQENNVQQSHQNIQKIEDSNIQRQNQKEKFNINIEDENFNLWDLSKDQKIQLVIQRYREYSLAKGTNTNQAYMQILSAIDDEAPNLLQKFEQSAQQIKWYESILSQQDILAYQNKFKKLIAQRQAGIDFWLKKYNKFQFDQSLVSPTRNITNSQFYQAMKYHQLTKETIENDPEMNKLYEKEKMELQQKYNISSYTNELRACVIVPTFNNVRNNRYLWNLQSILQQEYSNFKVIIIDDASEDGTSQKIAKHLLWRKANRDNYVLIRSKIRNKSLYSFYYGAHKYCDLGEIIFTIDGDDELIGTQVFKLVNAIYQKQKPYTLYTIFIANYPQNLTLSKNHEYNFSIKDQNTYRWDKSHGYSHLRTMLSDTFLLVNSSSFKSKDGRFFQLVTDNAVYFCALELSCKKVKFLQKINYWYDYNTGNNIFKQMSFKKYQTFVADVQKKMPYRCFHDYLSQSEKWHKSKN